MSYIDVFNGDADGICALIQLRKVNPQNAQLVTGVKRDINLLRHVNVTPDDQITVLDISFDKNHLDVLRLLNSGASIKYFDHHYSGVPINHPRLETIINDQSSTICTGLLVDQYISGQFREWALVAAFGDNMNNIAMSLGKNSGLDHKSLCLLQKLGIYINYNSYGENLSDLFYHPDVLYGYLRQYDSPLNFIQEDPLIYDTLETGYQKDIAMAQTSPFLYQSTESAIILLRNEKWAHRVNGTYISKLANQFPDRAHAIITENRGDTCTVSIRTPITRKTLPADQLALKFPSGGGRKSAAGINTLPIDQIGQFIEEFKTYFK